MSDEKTAATYLDQMTGYAKRLKDAAPTIDHAAWAADKRYIRINGGGLRPVSLCADSPCGAVRGHGVRKTTARIHGARHSPLPDEGVRKSKPEHRWQAALIEHALRWPQALPNLLHLQETCDEIVFVTDELKIDDIRADVVLIGRRGNVWFPIFVELKYGRLKTRLLKQLEDVQARSNIESFKVFLVAAAQARGHAGNELAASAIDLDRAISLMIWPSAQGIHTRIDKALCDKVHILEFPVGQLPSERFESPALPFSKVSVA